MYNLFNLTKKAKRHVYVAYIHSILCLCRLSLQRLLLDKNETEK